MPWQITLQKLPIALSIKIADITAFFRASSKGINFSSKNIRVVGLDKNKQHSGSRNSDNWQDTN